MLKSVHKVKLKSTASRPDYFFIFLVLFLTVFGVIMVGNASVVEAYRDFNDKFYYLKLQIRWAGLALGVFGIASLFKYQWLKKLAVPLLLVTIGCLVLVFVPGLGTQALGARRWLGLGPISFQPSEMAKLALIIYLAAFLSQPRSAWPCLALLGLLVGLIMLQPDLGTTVVLVAAAGVIYFVSGAPLWQIFLLLLLAVGSGAGLILTSAYRRKRLMTFLNPTHDPLGASYHIRQVLIALGSGGLFGVGLGQSRQKYEYLPEVTTDSIFAVIAEEAGFVGGVLVLLAFLLLIWRGLKVAQQASDDFGQLLAVGITAWLGIQAFINLAAMVALVPLTGIPLPFISYGGSSLVLALFAAGILVNISKYKVVKK